jgi:splicing factor 3A subunit 2
MFAIHTARSQRSRPQFKMTRRPDASHGSYVFVQALDGGTFLVPCPLNSTFDDLLYSVLTLAYTGNKRGFGRAGLLTSAKRRRFSQSAYFVHQGKVLHRDDFPHWFRHQAMTSVAEPQYLHLRLRILGGTDRQNRVGSKFGGGGVSSAQQGERERKERLKQLALESIDLAKDPYLVRNHLGSYECKLCLTLHRDEANYLAHTQGKKHQQGLARRAHLEKLKLEQEGFSGLPTVNVTQAAPIQKVRIGRPAYQVYKSRDSETNQRCLSFELQYPEIEEGLQPRHRFMSAYEQRVESPPDRRYQYLLFAAEPYETVAFKVPNESIDKGEDRFVTHWDVETKKFIVTMYFVEDRQKAP